MGIDVRWVVLLDNPPKPDEWRMLEALEGWMPHVLSPRLVTSADGMIRTLVVPSLARWVTVSKATKANQRHIKISNELELIQEAIGDLPLYYSNDNQEVPNKLLTREETYLLIKAMTPVDDMFSLVAFLLAQTARLDNNNE